MIKKENLSVNKLNKMINFVKEEAKDGILKYELDGSKIELTVKNRLSLSERGELIKDICSFLFIDDSYCPYLFKFATRYCIISYFTNMKFPEIGSIDRTEKIWTVLDSTTIYDDVIKMVGEDIINEILCETKEFIAFKKEAILKNTKFEAFFEGLETLVNNFNKQLGDSNLKNLLKDFQSQLPSFKDTMVDMVLNNKIDKQRKEKVE